MPSHILVTYSSPLGSAPEIAEAVAAGLRSKGQTADLADMKGVVTLDPYTAVVIGVPVYTGFQGLGEIGNFLHRFHEPLMRVPVAVFVIGLLPSGVQRDDEAVLAKTKKALGSVTPVSMAHFCGTLDSSKLSFWERMTLRIDTIPSGEFQDWDAIRAWAQSPPGLLKA